MFAGGLGVGGITYVVAASHDSGAAEPQSSAGLEVYPALAATPEGPGGVIGLGGRF
ncbi:MAG: hypothetical protein ACLFVJ_12490 [Persicimonas sp.]